MNVDLFIVYFSSFCRLIACALLTDQGGSFSTHPVLKLGFDADELNLIECGTSVSLNRRHANSWLRILHMCDLFTLESDRKRIIYNS